MLRASRRWWIPAVRHGWLAAPRAAEKKMEPAKKSKLGGKKATVKKMKSPKKTMAKKVGDKGKRRGLPCAGDSQSEPGTWPLSEPGRQGARATISQRKVGLVVKQGETMARQQGLGLAYRVPGASVAG